MRIIPKKQTLPLTAVSILEGLGVDALGVNCGFGPDKLGGVVDDLLKYASVPVIVKPNAGVPVVKDGKTEYDVPADTFAGLLSDMVKKGARAVGGCCGTTPEYICKLAEAVAGIKPVKPEKKEYAAVCSGVRPDGPALLPTAPHSTRTRLSRESAAMLAVRVTACSTFTK